MFDKGKKTAGIDAKIAAPSKAPSKGKSQPLVGKLGGDMAAMPGSKGKGQSIKTAPSNPIQGAGKSSGTAMGNGGVLPGFI